MSDTPAEQVKKSSRWKWIATLAVLAALIVFLTQQKSFDPDELLLHLARLPASAVVAAALCVLLQIGLQASRLWVLLEGSPWGRVARIFALGNFVNSFVPARAGDVYKIAALAKTTGSPERNTGYVAGVIVADKVVDMLALLSLLIFAGAQGLKDLDASRLPSPFTVLTIVAGVVAVIVAIAKIFPKAGLWIASLMRGIRTLMRPRNLVLAVLLGIASWVAEAYSLKILSGAIIGADFPLSQAIWALLVLNLGLAVPVSVANVGVHEASLTFALHKFGVPVEAGLAVAVVHHALQLGGITLWAAFATYFLRETFVEKKAFRVGEKDKEKAIAYYQGQGGNYNDHVGRGPLAFLRRREREAVLSGVSLEDGVKTLIDVGCGGGFYSLLAKRHNIQVCAVDAAPDMVKALSGKVDEARVEDIESLTLGQVYDRVLCTGVLDFVLNPEKAFENLCQLVAPGGRLVLLVPRTGIGGLYYRFEKWLSGFKINLYRPEWFTQRAERFGLTLRSVSYPLPNNMVLCFEKSGSAKA